MMKFYSYVTYTIKFKIYTKGIMQITQTQPDTYKPTAKINGRYKQMITEAWLDTVHEIAVVLHNQFSEAGKIGQCPVIAEERAILLAARGCVAGLGRSKHVC